MKRPRARAVEQPRCQLCGFRAANVGGLVCRTCHEAECALLGLDPLTGGPLCLPGELEWQARLRIARGGR